MISPACPSRSCCRTWCRQGNARHRHQVHQASLGRPCPREPDEEHQPPRAARDHDGQRARRQGNPLPAVRLPPRHGAGGHQARAVLGGRHHLKRAARPRAARLTGERQRAAGHDARHDARGSAAVAVLPRHRRDGAEARQHDPQGAGTHRCGVSQEAHRAVPRTALDQGRGLGAQSEEHRQSRPCTRGYGERLQEASGALRQRLPAAGAQAR